MNTPLALKLEKSGIRVHLCPSVVKPRVDQIDLPTARRLHGADYLRQRKSDGRHEFVTLPGFEPLNCELMPDGTHRINDVLIHGLDTRDRWRELQAMARHLPPGFELEKSAPILGGVGGGFLDDEIASGGEGIVLKPWGQAFGIGWLKAKRSENFIVRVTECGGGTQSVEIAMIKAESRKQKLGNSDHPTEFQLSTLQISDFSPCGKVKLGGGKCDQVRVGSLLKLTGYGLTAAGKIREPRPDNDTPNSWLVTY